MTAWPSVSYESLAWDGGVDISLGASSRLARLASMPYRSSIPPHIVGLMPELPGDLIRRADDLSADLARFDEAQVLRGYDLPSLLLRSESAASSQIEALTASARNVGLAEVGADAPRNSVLVARNILAMQRALSLASSVSLEGIRAIHGALMGKDEPLRSVTSWIGRAGSIPQTADFVPPASERVPALMEDLIAYWRTTESQAVVAAALAHAQFETIHPFEDGNGRTGRALMHVFLRERGVCRQTSVPLSAGLLHDVGGYRAALTAYREGDVAPIVECVEGAIELSLSLGSLMAGQMDGLLAAWDETLAARPGTSLWRATRCFVSEPVTTSARLAKALGVSQPTSDRLLATLSEQGIVSSVRRSVKTEAGYPKTKCYQADELLELIEDIVSLNALRRLPALRRDGDGA